MEQSRSFWAAFALLCGACALGAANPCVGVFALVYLAIALVACAAYLVMRADVRRVSDASHEASRDEAGRRADAMSRAALGFCSVFAVFAAVGTCVLTMLGLDPERGGRALLPVQLAPFDAALDLWALSAVMAVAAAVLLVSAGADVRRWLRRAR
ncbi:hypothetical protein ACULPM_08845 [Thermophilibacter sp. ZX-H3]|uniref:hypothetical protein n=1 Tax=unclassified Thermophilibacter TaxID=2847308 RepID=UPI004040826F